MKIGVLLDSSSGAIKEELQNTNIDVIPLHIILEDGTDLSDTRENIEKYDVYNRVNNKENVKTSQASPGELEIKYNEMLEKYDHIIHITITKNISSMQDTAIMVSKQPEFNGKVTVPEHNLAASAIKSCGLYLNKIINEGQKDIEYLVNEINEFEKSFVAIIVPGDLSKLARGGRAVKIFASILNAFKTKAVIHWAAKPKKIAMARKLSIIIEKVSGLLEKTYEGEEFNLTLLTTWDIQKRLLENTRVDLNNAKISFQETYLPSIYAVHAGIDTLGFIATGKKFEY
ncbi:DegV family protein [Spiroplasma sabaudiense Ar-1343]|uniref:DegV family protein n=1 Tax=Spiroplasma sabaudiense Ar-1343 TaxID=1276257 RepID=W6AAL3_9MOLU|nr:DegV family protein [Spiroplasma sabaudiense]AHI54102.1 DegV family protein [Spiroplasma sabaudiense Ar-1343]